MLYMGTKLQFTARQVFTARIEAANSSSEHEYLDILEKINS